MHDGNAFASIALILWVPVSVVLFTVMRPPLAGIAVLLGGTLLLPSAVAFDAPLVPPLNKHRISVLCALVGCAVFSWRRLRAHRPDRGTYLIMLVMLGSALATALSNRESLEFGSTTLAGLRPRDGLSLAIRDAVDIAMPFLLGHAVCKTTRDARQILTVLVLASLAYSLPILVELRMSPQMHVWVYGFHQHSFAQAVRAGGYRPMVFMHHGLSLALFMAGTCLAAATLVRQRMTVAGVPAGGAVAYLALIVVLCKSVAAIAYAGLLVPGALLLKPRTQLRVATVLAVLIVAYPALRLSGKFPQQTLLSVASLAGPNRVNSLEFRLRNEDLLAERARQKMVVGWGHGGRARAFDESGRDISTADGYWIIRLGSRGMVGLVTFFALLLWPVVAATRARKRFASIRDRRLLASLSLLVVAHAVDLLPNGLFNTLPLLYAGALLGLARSATTNRRGRPTEHEGSAVRVTVSDCDPYPPLVR